MVKELPSVCAVWKWTSVASYIAGGGADLCASRRKLATLTIDPRMDPMRARTRGALR